MKFQNYEACVAGCLKSRIKLKRQLLCICKKAAAELCDKAINIKVLNDKGISDKVLEHKIINSVDVTIDLSGE